MSRAKDFDVFLSYNRKDCKVVEQLGEELRERDLEVWLDVWEVPPGTVWQAVLEETIAAVQSAAVLVGPAGIGPWEQVEMRALLSEFVARERPLIPVLLPGAKGEIELPLLLKNYSWVDLRTGFNAPGMDQLHWGITGEKPNERVHLKLAKAKLARPQPDLPKVVELWRRATEIAREHERRTATQGEICRVALDRARQELEEGHIRPTATPDFRLVECLWQEVQSFCPKDQRDNISEEIENMAKRHEEQWRAMKRAQAAHLAVEILDLACRFNINWNQLRERRIYALVLEAILIQKEDVVSGRRPDALLNMAATYARALVDMEIMVDYGNGIDCVRRSLDYIVAINNFEARDSRRISSVETRLLRSLNLLRSLQHFDPSNELYSILFYWGYVSGHPMERDEEARRGIMLDFGRDLAEAEAKDANHPTEGQPIEQYLPDFYKLITSLDQQRLSLSPPNPRQGSTNFQDRLLSELADMIPMDVLFPIEAPDVEDLELGIVAQGADVILHAGRELSPRRLLDGVHKLERVARRSAIDDHPGTLLEPVSAEETYSTFKALLSEPIRLLIQKRRFKSGKTGRPIRIRLRSSASLEHWPLEMVLADYLERGWQDPGNRPVLLARTLAQYTRAVPLVSSGGPLRTGLVGASACNSDHEEPVPMFAEYRSALSELESVQLEPVSGPELGSSIAALDARGIEILIFVGRLDANGDESRLLLSDPTGDSKAISSSDLVTMLTPLNYLRLVFLCTSNVEPSAPPPPHRRLVEACFQAGVSGVILAPLQVGERSLSEFWRQLMRELHLGSVFEAAAGAARFALRLEAPQAALWTAPVLYTNTEMGKSFRLRHRGKRVLPI